MSEHTQSVSTPSSSLPSRDAIEELPIPYLELDQSGIITYANRATRALHPPERGTLVGEMAWGLMATDEMESSCAAYFSLMESGDDPPAVYRSLFDRTGEFRDYIIHRSLILSPNGKPAGMRLACMDVTETNRALEEAQRVRSWMENIFESAPEAMLVTDAVGFVTSFNPAAEALLGKTPQELNGQIIEEVLPILSYTSDRNDSLTHSLMLEQPTRGVATIRDTQNGTQRVEISTSIVVDKDNYVTTGVVIALRKACG